MRTLATHFVRTVLLFSASLSGALAHADDDADDDNYVAGMRYVAIDVQGDNADARQYSATGSFTLGKHTWLEGSVGKLTDNSADATANGVGDLRSFGLGGGIAFEHLQFSANLNQYKNDGGYKQRDISAALDWRMSRFLVGLDVFYRNTYNSIDTVQNFPTLGLTNVAMHIDENLKGNGIGLHVDIDITDKLGVSLGGMSYNYDSDYELTSSTNPVLIRRLLLKHPTISHLIYLNNSGVTRSLALLDSTYHAGVRYQFTGVQVSATYYRDQALDTDDVTDTVTLAASIPLGDHFSLSPTVGQSSSVDADSVIFGSLSISYAW